jgi:hypothetical protein
LLTLDPEKGIYAATTENEAQLLEHAFNCQFAVQVPDLVSLLRALNQKVRTGRYQNTLLAATTDEILHREMDTCEKKAKTTNG